MQAFIATARTSVAYNEPAKAKFHRQAETVLRRLAVALGLKKGEFDLRHNQGGIAVSGEITLHSDNLYVQFSQSCVGPDCGFMWRTCNGRKDYTGGRNQWAKWDAVNDLETLARTMLAASAQSLVAADKRAASSAEAGRRRQEGSKFGGSRAEFPCFLRRTAILRVVACQR
jgi:hypothetical protein